MQHVQSAGLLLIDEPVVGQTSCVSMTKVSLCFNVNEVTMKELLRKSSSPAPNCLSVQDDDQS